MKITVAAVMAAAYWAACATSVSAVDPVQKVLQLLDNLEAKVVKDGEESQQVYEEFAEQCEDRSRQLHQTIKDVKLQLQTIQANLEQAGDEIESSSTQIDELSSKISSDEGQLKDATEVWKSEAKDFAAAEEELLSAGDTLERAISIIERKGLGGDDASQASAASLTQTLQVMVAASSIGSAEASRLTSMLQDASGVEGSLELSAEADADADESLLGAPDSAAYEQHGGGVLKTLEGLLDKSRAQLEESRKTETTASHSYELLKQSLEDKIKIANDNLVNAKTSKGSASEREANSQRNFEVAQNDLASNTESLEALHHGCMSRAADFEEETSSRNEEIKALGEARKVISEFSGGASVATYGGGSSPALVQIASSSRGGSDARLPADAQAAHVVRRLARHWGDASMAQLAARVDAVVREGARVANNADVFKKVGAMISDMLAKMQQEAEEDATKKAFCDKEMSEAKAKQEDKSSDVEGLTAKIDTMTSQVQGLTADISKTQQELLDLAKAQSMMDKTRAEGKAAHDELKKTMQEGVDGVQTALKILREYYSRSKEGYEAAEGVGTSIIGLLEVVESDFSKGLSEVVAEEDAALRTYEEETKMNAVLKTGKDKDLAYMTKEVKALEKNLADLSSDRDGTSTELAAVSEYLAKLEAQCVAKAEPYDMRKARRTAEIQGLKDALAALTSDEPALLQVASHRRLLRGTRGRARTAEQLRA